MIHFQSNVQQQPVAETSIGAGGWNLPGKPGNPSNMPGEYTTANDQGLNPLVAIFISKSKYSVAPMVLLILI